MTATIGVRRADRVERRVPVAVVTTDGHSWSWTELFETFGPAIRSFARAKGVSTPDDIVQEVFVVAVEKLQRFRGDSAGLRSLLFTIAYRRIADEHRRFYRRPETLVATHAAAPDTAPQIEDVVGSRETVDQAIQAFSVLNTRERYVLEMRIFLDATPAQVADSIGISSGNVRVIQSRALSKIRRHLESVRNEGASRTIATFAVLFDSVRYLGVELPGKGLLGGWVAEVSDTSAKAAGTYAAVSGGVAATSAGTGAGSAVASVTSASVVASSAANVVMIVALTASTIASGVIATASESFAPSDVVVSEEIRISGPHPVDDLEGAESANPRSGSLVETSPGSSSITRTSGPIGATSTEPDGIVPFAVEVIESNAGAAEQVAASVSGDVLDPIVGSVLDDVVDPLVGAAVDEVVDPLVDDVVDPLVETVVDPLVDPVGDVVDPLVDPVEDVVDPLVDPVEDVVDPLVDPVEDVVDPLTDDVVDPLAGELVDDLELPPILGGLLGN